MLSGPQLQARLGISYRTLHRMRQSGRGPLAYRVGREWRYRVEDVDSWLANQQRAGGVS
jgi:excisionase family DNA binding protein